MKLFRVLHLSDIHVGDTYADSEDIAYRIISDIESENISDIQCVIVTGDIFEGSCGQSDNIVSEAVKFFNIIFNELKASRSSSISKNDFLFVPGNHDIIRAEDESKRWTKYRAFLSGFYGSIPDFYDPNDFSLLKTYDENRIAFAGFNSCGLKEEALFDSKLLKDINKIDDSLFNTVGFSKDELLKFVDTQTKNKTFVDFGEIAPKQILNVKRELRKYDDYNIVAFFHHHFYLFPEVYSKYGDSSLIRNYTNIIQQLQQAHVKTVLHGHKHFDLERPLITDSYYENAKDVINIIAGGSVGTSRVSKHTFNIIDFYDKDSDVELVQRKFVYNNDKLEPVIIRQIPPKAGDDNSSIKLLNIFKLNNLDLFSLYSHAIEKINIVADDYNNMLKWLENVFVGFDEIHKMFEKDTLCVFFLLYAMNYRVLKIKQILGGESIDSSYYKILNDLLFDNIKNVSFDKTQYLTIFEQSDLNKLKKTYDEIFDTIQNKKDKYYLSFSMIAIFITDIYLMLRYYAGSFYNKYIKYKVNIKLDETEFHQNVPVQKIMIHSDADRRSAFIDLRCNSATAHKLSVLFVKEFELMISEFEDYFKTVGLKLYYLTPKIEKSNIPNAIDNYNFEAYIPTLIPLLTGDNIYAKKEVFARELIQNSIDAIAVRASKDANFDQTIYITIGQEQGRKFFKIKDFGTGMDRFKIERYFTSIGRSFYSGTEYRDLEINYKPISNFGIGFLSAFMICREIDVKTRYYLDEKEGLKLHIPNYDGCFFIEKDDTLDIGTEITLYIDEKISHDIQPEKIVEYIHNTMKDIAYTISIKNDLTQQEELIESRAIRRNVSKDDLLFVPFMDSGEIVKDVCIEETIRNGDFIEKYPYGLLIDVTGEHFGGTIMNSGIELHDTSIEEVWGMLLKNFDPRTRFFNNFFLFNFPSNYLNIDVSREKIAGLTDVVTSDFKIVLMSEISKQITEYINLCQRQETQNKAINLHFLIMDLVELCKKDSKLSNFTKNLMRMKYVLYVQFKEDTIDLIVNRRDNRPAGAVAYTQKNHSTCFTAFNKFTSVNSNGDEKIILSLQKEMPHRMFSQLHAMLDMPNLFLDGDLENYYYRYRNILLKMEEELRKRLRSKNDNMVYVFLFLLTLLPKEDGRNNHSVVMENLLIMLLGHDTVSQVERGKCRVSIQYNDIKEVLKRLSLENK
ncbi:MAG: metallophosphoesterase [Candidatus Fimenecus sp.]